MRLKLPKPIRSRYNIAKYRLREWMASIHASPVFVLGNQKSGTTAIAALLAKATGQTATLDFFFRRDPWEVQRYHEGALSLKAICQRNKLEFSRKIIKDPDLTFFATDLVESFPNAKFVFIVRNPYQNIRSILNRWSIPGSLQDLPPEIRQGIETSVSWRTIFEGIYPPTSGHNHVATLANRWCLANEAYREIQSHCYLLRYEDFCGHKEKAIAEIASQLELEVHYDIRKDINRPFQPKGKDASLKPVDFFSTGNLQTITRLCWPAANDFGYTPVG